jgi:preprotein translocase subunit YajC
VITALFAATSTKSSGSPITSLIFFGAIFAGMYFVMLRPQRRRMRESQSLQSSLAVNDEVLLTSGIFGFITEIDGDVVWVDIADGHDKERIEVRVTRSSVARKVVPAADAASGSDAK